MKYFSGLKGITFFAQKSKNGRYYNMKKTIKLELKEIMEKYGWNNIEDIHWNLIYYKEPLSEDFIREHKDKLMKWGL